MKKAGLIKKMASLAAMAAAFCIMAVPAFAAEGKVIGETVKIRANASTDSAVVGSTSRGKTVDIQEAVKDSAGTVWYKVPLAGGGYGYIRGDLVETSETIEVSASAPATQPAESTSKPAETVPTSIGEQQAVIKAGNNVRIRSGASTQHDTVASLPDGTSITLIGEANDSAGNKWYQLTCNYNGRTIQGYVRSDLIAIGAQPAAGEGEGGESAGGEGQEVPEGENPEGENPEDVGDEPFEDDFTPEPEHNDYEIVYEPNSESGEYEYYLYMNEDGTKVKVNELLTAVNSARENTNTLQEQVEKEKIIIIILAVVIVLLFIVITVLLFKIRGLYYEDDEDEEEEEEEEEEEPAPVRKKVRRPVAEEEEASAPVRKKRPPTSGESKRPARPQEKSGQQRSKGEKEMQGAEKKEPVKKAAQRKPQNFLLDDDEFEFEFLNMDDKDI